MGVPESGGVGGGNLCYPRSIGICVFPLFVALHGTKGDGGKAVVQSASFKSARVELAASGSGSLPVFSDRGPVFSATFAKAVAHKWSVVLTHTERRTSRTE